MPYPRTSGKPVISAVLTRGLLYGCLIEERQGGGTAIAASPQLESSGAVS
jgi:hypothetical protein